LKRNLNLAKNIEKAAVATIKLQIIVCKQNTKKYNKNINKTVDIVKYINSNFLLCNFVIAPNTKHIVFEIDKIKLY